MKRRSFVGLAASLALFPQAIRAATGFRSGGLIDTVDLNGAPGLSLAVVSAGKTIEIGGKGQKGFDHPSVPGADTLFEIGSLTKTFTASLIFELEAERQLDVDAPVGAYLPNLPRPWRNVTLSMLLSHICRLRTVQGRCPDRRCYRDSLPQPEMRLRHPSSQWHLPRNQ